MSSRAPSTSYAQSTQAKPTSRPAQPHFPRQPHPIRLHLQRPPHPPRVPFRLLFHLRVPALLGLKVTRLEPLAARERDHPEPVSRPEDDIVAAGGLTVPRWPRPCRHELARELARLGAAVEHGGLRGVVGLG